MALGENKGSDQLHSIHLYFCYLDTARFVSDMVENPDDKFSLDDIS